MKLNRSKPEDMLNIVLFQKQENVQFNPPHKLLEQSSSSNTTKTKKEPKTKIEMIKSSENKGDISISSEIYGKEINNSKAIEHIDNSRRISCEEEPSTAVPKIEISLNEWFKENKEGPTSLGRSQSARKYTVQTSIEKSKNLN